jgi:hypothetical protein
LFIFNPKVSALVHLLGKVTIWRTFQKLKNVPTQVQTVTIRRHSPEFLKIILYSDST